MKCQECDEDTMLPFICSYCGGVFCSTHRLPEYHKCINQPKQASSYLSPLEQKSENHGSLIEPRVLVQKHSKTKKVIGFVIVAAVVLSAVYIFYNYSTSPIAITGRVMDVVSGSVQNGVGLSDVELRVTNSNGMLLLTNKTTSTGYFSFNDLPHGSYSIEVAVPNGYVTRSATAYQFTNTRNVEFRLENLLVNPKTMHYTYTLRGHSSEIPFTLYKGMYDYLVSIENSTVSYVGQEPSNEEVDRIITQRYIDEGIEKGELSSLVENIREITANEDDQVRIAVSLVQNIPYNWNLTNKYDWKYPYEILYSGIGACGEKSHLLVCLLRELGYGCSLLTFTEQNHQGVGIACPSEYAYYSEYAFVECTAPSIITDWQGDYVGAGKLPSSPSYNIVVQNGKVMNSISEEYKDAQTFLSLINMGPVLDEYHYSLWQTIVTKYGIQVSP